MTHCVEAKRLVWGVAIAEASLLHGMFLLSLCLGCLCVIFDGKDPAHCCKMIHNIKTEGRAIDLYLKWILLVLDCVENHLTVLWN